MSDTTINFFNTSLERYEIQEKLGTGGMARVYRAYDANLKRQVAVKILHEHLSEDPTFASRFEREAHLVADFNHPNIVQIYDYNTIKRGDESLAFMVMSYIPGKTLQQVLDELIELGQRMQPDEVHRIVKDITTALDYAHMKGMVHRDVKPANILFDAENRAVLTDFGIARLVENSNLTQEGLTVGTPAYMSPEQATGQPIDARSDIYALGVIVYELLAGHPPFEDDGSISVLLKHVNEPPPPLSKYGDMDDPHLDAVIRRALAKDPSERYQSALEFLEDLDLAFAGQAPKSAKNTVTDNNKTPFTIPVVPVSPADATEPQADNWIKAFQSSPLALLVTGLAVVALVLFVGLFNQQNDGQAADTITADETINEDASVSSMTGDMRIYFMHDFEANEEYQEMWPQGEPTTGISREILNDEGVYRIDNQRSGQAIATIFSDQSFYEDVVIEMSASLTDDSAAVSGYGIIFRYMDESNYNVFAVDGMGRFSIWTLENGNWTELRETAPNLEWQSNDAVNEIGEVNTLSLEIEGNQFRGMVNGELVTLVVDETFAGGNIGVYIAAPPAVGDAATVLIDRYTVTEPFSAVNSMTGNEYLDNPGGPNNALP